MSFSYCETLPFKRFVEFIYHNAAINTFVVKPEICKIRSEEAAGKDIYRIQAFAKKLT